MYIVNFNIEVKYYIRCSVVDFLWLDIFFIYIEPTISAGERP